MADTHTPLGQRMEKIVRPFKKKQEARPPAIPTVTVSYTLLNSQRSAMRLSKRTTFTRIWTGVSALLVWLELIRIACIPKTRRVIAQTFLPKPDLFALGNSLASCRALARFQIQTGVGVLVGGLLIPTKNRPTYGCQSTPYQTSWCAAQTSTATPTCADQS